MLTNAEIDNGRLTSRLHKSCCCPSYVCACNCIWRPCRKAVSGHKVRYRKEGFDLDLTQVAPRIIVHGFPAIGIEHIYRNPRYELKRYLELHHKDHYKVYNFCCEYGRSYEPEVYEGRVERYPFKDHNTPPLETMIAFANSAKRWLDADPENVVSMHCKAGKGRAGLMCCVLLIRSGICQSAVEALDLYDRTRVDNNKGLTVTSQRKFVVFYEALWRQCWGVGGNIGDIGGEDEAANPEFTVPEQPELNLQGVELVNFPSKFFKQYCVKVYNVTNTSPKLLYDSGPQTGNEVSIECSVNIEKNFKVMIFRKTGLFSKYKKVMELLHNTYFMDKNASHVDFNASQLDMKRKIKAILGADIRLRLSFQQSSDISSAAAATTSGDDTGYTALVATDENGSIDAGGIELHSVDDTKYAVVPS